MKPNDTELVKIYTNTVNDTSKCYGWNQWTEWNSVGDPLATNGNEYETLQDHIFHNK